LPDGPDGGDHRHHHHTADHQDHQEADEFVATPKEAAPEELGRRSFQPPALALASRQRRLQSGVFLAWLGRFPFVPLKLKFRFTQVVFEPPQHDARAAAFVGRCSNRHQSVIQFCVTWSGPVGGPEFLY
jgi:hypothetical protein